MKETQALLITRDFAATEAFPKYNVMDEILKQMTDPETRYNGFSISVNIASKDYKTIFSICAKLGLNVKVAGYSVKSTKEEIEQANYFRLIIGNMGAEDYSESYDTKYEPVFTCEKCGRSIYSASVTVSD